MISAKEYMKKVNKVRQDIKNSIKKNLENDAIAAANRGHKLFEMIYFEHGDFNEQFDYDNFEYKCKREILEEIEKEIEKDFTLLFREEYKPNSDLNDCEEHKCTCNLKWIHQAIVTVEVVEPDEMEEMEKILKTLDDNHDCKDESCRCNELENVD